MSGSFASPFEAVRSVAVRLDGMDHDYDALLEAIGERPLVLLGEATHGTREFYRMRADITRRLIVEKGFDAVLVEADWPDASRLDRYVRGEGGDSTAREAFADFQRFPRWMWCNSEVLRFIEWLHEHNASCRPDALTGFYGLDMYSMYRSAEAVIAYLEGVDDEQASIARRQYASLDHVRDPQGYGYEVVAGLRPDCQQAVQERLAELMRRAPEYVVLDGPQASDKQFFAERNAHVVTSAEAYYREMFGSRASSWNRRDQHMSETLFALHRHLRSQGRQGRIAVWAHNSHVGDARATQMSEVGEWNVGQLVRQRMGVDQSFLVGFTTYTGTVTAASEWDGPAERKVVNPARVESYEGLFYRTHLDRFCLPLGEPPVARALRGPMLERAIGVLYRPQSERASHYFEANLSSQFDAVFHLDETEAVEPFDDEGADRARAPHGAT